MNKKRVNEWIAPAAELLKETGIADKDGTIDSTFRGQISSFGAAVTMGSLKAAVAFFSQQGGAKVSREKLLVVLYCLINCGAKVSEVTAKDVFEYVCDHDKAEEREMFLDAAVATKLAMNLYTLKKEGNTHEESESAVS